MIAFKRSKTIHGFAQDSRGNVAMIFGLVLIPLIGLVGSAIDYTMAANARTQLQVAADGTALALAHEARGLSAGQLQARAQTEFKALYAPTTDVAAQSVAASLVDATLKIQAKATVTTAFMGMFGIPTLDIGAGASSTFDTKKIELALVLDNTGSMANNNKMVELKKAVNNLVTELEKASAAPGDIKLSIVPFNTEVKIPTSSVNALWLRWDVTLENPNMTLLQRTPPTQAIWAGCISDRDQPFDAASDPSAGGSSRHVASKCHYAGLAPMAALTSDLESVRAVANSMQPTGATNITVGLTTGLATLRSDSPFGTASSNASNVIKFLVLLTDGNNTQNRWGGNGADFNAYAPEIDQRLSTACQAARASQPVRVFTIRVMDGNAPLLKGCASDPGMYYDVQNASQLQPVFQSILSAISGIRLAS